MSDLAVNATGLGGTTLGASARMGYAEGFNKGVQAGADKFQTVVIMLFVAYLVQVLASRYMKMCDADSYEEGGTWYRVADRLEHVAFAVGFTAAAFLLVMSLGIPFFTVAQGGIL